jgi:MFS family permease
MLRGALAQPAFRWYMGARLAGFLGVQMQGVAVGWQVYELTQNPLHLGYVGLAQFLPALLLTLPAGMVADRFERRRVLFACHGVLSACAAALCLLSLGGAPPVSAIYAILVVVGAARAFAGPAGQSLMPNLVPPEDFTNAVAWSSTVWHTANLAGPALGGLLYAARGSAADVHGSAALLEIGGVCAIGVVRAIREQKKASGGASWHELVAGARYVWRRRVILGAVSLDMFAVLLGGAVALLPVFARDILHVGPQGLGLLRSAPAAGAVAMAVLLAHRPIARRAGAVLLASVLVFGLATIGFGLSRAFELSLALLVIAGAADMVSVFVRHAVVQLATPDEMRGRVAAINLLFIGTSNELGELESGLTAAWLGTVRAVVAGGVGTCLVVLAWAGLFPALRRVDRLDAEALGE